MKCALFLAGGFEECEAMITVDLLRRGHLEVDTYSITEEHTVTSSHNIEIRADKVWAEFVPEEYDVLILPGGKRGTKNLEAFAPLKEAIAAHVQAGKVMAAICAAPSILGHMGLLQGKHYTCFPDFDEASFNGTYEWELAVVDGKLVTGRGMGASIEFARSLLQVLTDEKTLDEVDRGIQYEHRFRSFRD